MAHRKACKHVRQWMTRPMTTVVYTVMQGLTQAYMKMVWEPTLRNLDPDANLAGMVFTEPRHIRAMFIVSSIKFHRLQNPGIGEIAVRKMAHASWDGTFKRRNSELQPMLHLACGNIMYFMPFPGERRAACLKSSLTSDAATSETKLKKENATRLDDAKSPGNEGTNAAELTRDFETKGKEKALSSWTRKRCQRDGCMMYGKLRCECRYVTYCSQQCRDEDANEHFDVCRYVRSPCHARKGQLQVHDLVFYAAMAWLLQSIKLLLVRNTVLIEDRGPEEEFHSDCFMNHLTMAAAEEKADASEAKRHIGEATAAHDARHWGKRREGSREQPKLRKSGRKWKQLLKTVREERRGMHKKWVDVLWGSIFNTIMTFLLHPAPKNHHPSKELPEETMWLDCAKCTLVGEPRRCAICGNKDALGYMGCPSGQWRCKYCGPPVSWIVGIDRLGAIQGDRKESPAEKQVRILSNVVQCVLKTKPEHPRTQLPNDEGVRTAAAESAGRTYIGGASSSADWTGPVPPNERNLSMQEWMTLKERGVEVHGMLPGMTMSEYESLMGSTDPSEVDESNPTPPQHLSENDEM